MCHSYVLMPRVLLQQRLYTARNCTIFRNIREILHRMQETFMGRG